MDSILLDGAPARAGEKKEYQTIEVRRIFGTLWGPTYFCDQVTAAGTIVKPTGVPSRRIKDPKGAAARPEYASRPAGDREGHGRPAREAYVNFCRPDLGSTDADRSENRCIFQHSICLISTTFALFNTAPVQHFSKLRLATSE